jgi:hypothetical protein
MSLSAAHETGWTTPNKVPRFQAYLRHGLTVQEDTSRDRAGGGRGGNARRDVLSPCVSIDAQALLQRPEGSQVRGAAALRGDERRWPNAHQAV